MTDTTASSYDTGCENLSWWCCQDTNVWYPARCYPDSSAALRSTHSKFLKRRALLYRTQEITEKVQATPIVLVFTSSNGVQFKRLPDAGVLDTNFEERWEELIVSGKNEDMLQAVYRAVHYSTNTSTNPSNTPGTTTIVRTVSPRVATEITVTPLQQQPAPNARRNDQDNESDFEPAGNNNNDDAMETEPSQEQESVENQADSDDDESMDEDQTVVLEELDPHTSVQEAWKLHEEMGWFTQRDRGSFEVWYVKAGCSTETGKEGIDYFSSLDDFAKRFLSVQYPGWEGTNDDDLSFHGEEEEEEDAGVITPVPKKKKSPNAKKTLRRVVTTAKKPAPKARGRAPSKQEPSHRRSSRQRTAPILDQEEVIFDWDSAATELISNQEAWKILSKALPSCKKSAGQYILPGMKQYPFASIEGVQLFLCDHGVPGWSKRKTERVKSEEVAQLSLWIACAKLTPVERGIFHASTPLETKDHLILRLTEEHKFFYQDPRLYKPKYRDDRDSRDEPASWEHGRHWWFLKHELHTSIRAFVASQPHMRHDPQLMRWCLAGQDLNEADEIPRNMKTYTSMVAPAPVEDKPVENTPMRATVKKAPRKKTPQGKQIVLEDVPFDQDVLDILTKMGFTKERGGKYTLPWWQKQSFSLASVRAILRNLGAPTDSLQELGHQEVEKLRRWAIYSIVGVESADEFYAIPPPKKEEMRFSLLKARWTCEPGRIYVPNFKNIPNHNGDWVRGKHYFERSDYETAFHQDEEMNIRRYIRRNPESAGDSLELLKWAAKDSSAIINTFDSLSPAATVEMIRLSLEEVPNKVKWYLSGSIPEWEDVRYVLEKTGLQGTRRAGFFYDWNQGSIWRNIDNVRLFFLKEGIPNASVLDAKELVLLQRWASFVFVPPRSNDQLSLAEGLVNFIPTESLVSLAGLKDQDVADLEALRIHIRQTRELVSCETQTSRSRRAARAGASNSSEDSAEEAQLYMLALRLWAATCDSFPVYSGSTSKYFQSKAAETPQQPGREQSEEDAETVAEEPAETSATMEVGKTAAAEESSVSADPNEMIQERLLSTQTDIEQSQSSSGGGDSSEDATMESPDDVDTNPVVAIQEAALPQEQERPLSTQVDTEQRLTIAVDADSAEGAPTEGAVDVDASLDEENPSNLDGENTTSKKRNHAEALGDAANVDVVDSQNVAPEQMNTCLGPDQDPCVEPANPDIMTDSAFPEQDGEQDQSIGGFLLTQADEENTNIGDDEYDHFGTQMDADSGGLGTFLSTQMDADSEDDSIMNTLPKVATQGSAKRRRSGAGVGVLGDLAPPTP